jgi:diguanylate cyclase (GGDEF)-like protein/PAS domain S-box-containing protein
MKPQPSVVQPTEPGFSPQASVHERMTADQDWLLARILEVGSIILLLFLGIQQVLAPEPQLSQALMAFLLVGLLPARLAIRLRGTRLARLWTVGIISLGIMVLPIWGSGMYAPLFAMIPLVLLMAAWLLGRRAMLVLGFAFALVLWSYWLAQTRGVYVPPLPPRSIDIWLLVDLMSVVLTVVVTWGLLRSYESAQVAQVKLHAELTREAERSQAALAFNRNLLESMRDGLSVLDASGIQVDANPALCRITGFSREELVGAKAPFPFWPPEAFDSIRAAFAQTLRGEGGEFELTFMRKNGERFAARVLAFTVHDAAGNTVNFAGIISDITAAKRVQAQIYRLAFYDPLTNLPNRRLLTDRMHQSLAACKRSGKFAALMVLDLDNFKPLNDAHGHAAGDLLLVDVAQRIKSCVREVDTVARFGGDEFVVLVQDLSSVRSTSKELVAAIAEKIRLLLAQPYQMQVEAPGGGASRWVEHHCAASVGVTIYDDRAIDATDLLKRADQAMYQAKQAGRNRVCFDGVD